MHTKAFSFDQQPRFESVLLYAVLTTYAMLPRAHGGKNKQGKKKRYPINSLMFGLVLPQDQLKQTMEYKEENQFTF